MPTDLIIGVGAGLMIVLPLAITSLWATARPDKSRRPKVSEPSGRLPGREDTWLLPTDRV
ncbi:MAG: hypothetical protein LGR52_11760 [Candidatus Thiosymbion ectosymbiont of Robbea hypermnestra]|nr:hypothetical protein [Candidatus Thiosymbion ectosymbiont of Robbea hypermnestra]